MVQLMALFVFLGFALGWIARTLVQSVLKKHNEKIPDRSASQLVFGMIFVILLLLVTMPIIQSEERDNGRSLEINSLRKNVEMLVPGVAYNVTAERTEFVPEGNDSIVIADLIGKASFFSVQIAVPQKNWCVSSSAKKVAWRPIVKNGVTEGVFFEP